MERAPHIRAIRCGQAHEQLDEGILQRRRPAPLVLAARRSEVELRVRSARRVGRPAARRLPSRPRARRRGPRRRPRARARARRVPPRRRRATSAGGRSKRSPWPPPPGVRTLSTSPGSSASTSIFGQRALAGGARVQHHAAGRAGGAAGHAPRREAQPLHAARGHQPLGAEDLEVQPHGEAAAEPTGSSRVRDQVKRRTTIGTSVSSVSAGVVLRNPSEASQPSMPSGRGGRRRRRSSARSRSRAAGPPRDPAAPAPPCSPGRRWPPGCGRAPRGPARPAPRRRYAARWRSGRRTRPGTSGSPPSPRAASCARAGARRRSAGWCDRA